MLLSSLADRLVLTPSRHELFSYGKSRQLIAWQKGQIEVWTERTSGDPLDDNSEFAPEPACFVLKLGGKAARAERSTLDPLDHWSDLPGEIWSVNPPGYGGSCGAARLHSIAPSAERVLEHLVRRADGRPIFIAGDSLGTMSALYLAARHGGQIAGLILRNAGPLKRMITARYAWHTLGLSHLLARQVPDSLDSIANAAAATVPAVMLTSGNDEIMPPRFQQLVAAAYAGPLKHLVLPRAEHDMRLTRRDRHAYGLALDWLREQTLGAAAFDHCPALTSA